MGYYRTVNCGTINKDYLQQEVTLCGWVNKIRVKKRLVFIDIRDMYGITQAIIKADQSDFSMSKNIKLESVIKVRGLVGARTSQNDNLATGAVEVVVTSLQVLSHAAELPFAIKDDVTAGEDLRLQYRYLDLRRPVMQKSLLLKQQVINIFRNYLSDHQFLDIETPSLVKPSVEGAREFLIPARLQKNSYYTLAQSPQMYKQLLMFSGIDKYYQIAKCFRDEDLRSDRQPEFLQLDMEMAFVTVPDILAVVEKMLSDLATKLNLDFTMPLLRLPYDVAINKYGTDKPDLRCQCEISTISPALRAFFVNDIWNNKTAAAILRIVEQHHGKNLLVYDSKKGAIIFRTNNDLSLTDAALTQLGLLAGDNKKNLCYLTLNESAIVLGAIRTYYCHDAEKKRNHHDFLQNEHLFMPLWITEWPMFEKVDNKLVACHHPFTNALDPLALLNATDEASLLKLKAAAYDLVINGYEVAGGSIRIHDKKLQEKVFAILGLDENAIKAQFGFFLKAFDYGVPPHGGIAFGLDRLVMILHRNQSIRDSIAFPKNNSGICLLSDAPTKNIDLELLSALGLKIIADNEDS